MPELGIGDPAELNCEEIKVLLGLLAFTAVVVPQLAELCSTLISIITLPYILFCELEAA